MSEVKVEEKTDNKLLDLYIKVHALRSEMGSVKKGRKNDFFDSKYADINAYLALLNPLFEKYKLLLTQPTVASGMNNVILTRITDLESGAQLESSFILPANDNMQKLGSAITYARRYTLGALLGMCAEDDDGNAASGKTKKTGKTKITAEDF